MGLVENIQRFASSTVPGALVRETVLTPRGQFVKDIVLKVFGAFSDVSTAVMVYAPLGLFLIENQTGLHENNISERAYASLFVSGIGILARSAIYNGVRNNRINPE